MTLSRRREPDRPDLSPETIAVLLAGWCAEPPEPQWRSFGGGFLTLYESYARPDDGIIRLWTQHETFLRETARRWGWEPSYQLPSGRRLFYGEYCALPETDKADARELGDDDDDDDV